MIAGPGEDAGNLVPIVDILKLHLLDRRTCDYHAVEFLVTHLLEVTIEHHHVLYGSVFRSVTLEFHKTDLHLQRCVRQQTDEVGLCSDLEWHEIQNHDFQWAYVLSGGAGIVHHEDVLALKQLDGW